MGLILHHFLYSLNIMEKRESYTAFGHQDHAYSVNRYTDLLRGLKHCLNCELAIVLNGI